VILVDTSVWIDHLRITNLSVVRAISDDLLLMHPFVLGELAMGSLRDRTTTLRFFLDLEAAPVASPTDILDFVQAERLFNLGIGYVDAHLLASCRLHGNCRLLTYDRRLQETAAKLGIAA
jgi:predicted nucleic acid-binding protein